MKKIIFLVLVNLLFLNNQVTFAYHKNNPIVKTSLGDIKGSILTTALGKDIFSFRGIRYAKAPIDELRFQPPVPVDKWDDVYDATEDGPICPQPKQNRISEDCLMLNVYTTLLPDKHQNVKRPVLVFIPPGGCYGMAGTSDWFGPQYILDQDLVLVTINYRLASLGFMSTGDELAPGNNGLKDQVVALRWIQANIASFGGNPNLVTIAGCGSVSLHMVSPMSKGLFHRVIAMGVTYFGNRKMVKHQFETAQKHAQFFNCPHDNSTTIIQCLKTKTAKEIGDTLNQFLKYMNSPVYLWPAVIEPDYGQERFLTENPVESVRRGDFVKVPVMTGFTISETDYARIAFKNELLVMKLMMEDEDGDGDGDQLVVDEEFEKVAPVVFLRKGPSEKLNNFSWVLEKAYLNNKPITKELLSALGKLCADGNGGYGIYRAAKLLALKNSFPTYYYRFSYEGRYNYYRKIKNNETEGMTSIDNLLYLFYISHLPKFTQTDPEYEMVRRFTKIFYNFAVEGKPILAPTPDLDNVSWDPVVPGDTVQYMNIGKKLEMKTNLYANRYAVCENFFPIF